MLDLIQQGLAAGVQPAAYLASLGPLKEIVRLREFFGVSEDEHARMLTEVTHDDARYVDHARKLMDAFRHVETLRFSLASDPRPESRLVRHALLLRQRLLIHEFATVVASIDAPEVAGSFAQSLYALSGPETEAALLDATAALSPELRDAFRRSTADKVFCSYSDVARSMKPADDALRVIAADRDWFVASLAVSGLVAAYPADARVLVDQFWPRDTGPSAFLKASRETARLGQRPVSIVIMAELLSVEAFQELDLQSLAIVAEASTLRHYQAGDQVCRAGEDSESIFLLVSGETETWVEGDQGRVTLGRGGKGTVFGELGVITRRPRSASVEVSSESASVVSIPKAIIDDLLERDLPATRGILKVVSGYLLNTISATLHTPHPAAHDTAEAR